jgi:Rrf2 family protein
MRVSQRLDYALKTLVLLAAQPAGSFTAAGQLADRLGLPRRFVEQQITELSRAGIVRCRRGASGGCALEAEPTEITALDVVVALQGDVIDVPRQPGSASAVLWQGMAAAAEGHLASTTLADLLKAQRELDASLTPMYYI